MTRLGYTIREVADMLGYKSASGLYECVYLPSSHPDHIPTFRIPGARGDMRIPAAWVYQQIEQQTGMARRVVEQQSVNAETQTSANRFGTDGAGTDGAFNSREETQ